MIEFRPIICRKKHIDLIYKALSRFLFEYYLHPILKVIEPIKGFYNNSLESDVVINALREGKIQYIDGHFIGKFDAKLTKALYALGAKWNKRLKCFDINRSELSMEIIGAIGTSMTFAMALRKALSEVLSTLTIDNVLPDLKEILDIPLDVVLEDLDGQFTGTFFKPKKPSYTPVADRIQESITVHPKLDEYQAAELKTKYTDDVTLSIKTFTDEETIKLRQIVEKNTLEGLNNDTLIRAIQREFDTTYKKAKFLARNETEIFTAKFQEVRCQSIGIYSYKWLAVGDERTRPIHKQLSDASRKYGATYRWDNPPVTDEKGNTHNPGEDYNCRCVAQPVLSV